MVRLVILNPVFGNLYSGAEIVILNLLANINRNKFEPIVIIAGPGKFSKSVTSYGIDVIFAPKLRAVPAINPAFIDYSIFLFHTLFAVPQLIKLLIQLKPDLIHTNTRGGHITGGLAGMVLGIPVLMHFQDHPSHPEPYMLLGKLCAKKIVVASETTGNWLVGKKYRDWGKNVDVVYAGVDTNLYQPFLNNRRIIADYQLYRYNPILISVGILEHRKGYLDLVNAFSTVKKWFPEAYLLIVGIEFEEGTFLPHLKERISNLDLEDSIALLGWREDVPQLLVSADLFILASLDDPYPTAVLEAMASGRPVITTNSGGCVEIIENEKNGIIIPPNQPKILANTIVKLLQNPEKMELMGMAARKVIEEKASVDIFASEMERVYSSLL